MTFDARESSGYSGQPVELYLFVCGSQKWCYTSGDAEAVYAGDHYVPDPISRGSIDMNGEDEQGNVTLELARTNAVAEMFIADLPVNPVYLMIRRYHRGDDEYQVFWTGEVVSCAFKGSKATLTGLPVSRVLRRQIPGPTFQAQCNWALFSERCGLSKANFMHLATISAISGIYITATAFGTHSSGYFRSGWVEDASGETHWITEHVMSTLTLMTPFRSLRVGSVVSVYPGCDRTMVACQAFGNRDNFCGFEFLPSKNPFVTGM
jgi:uncharacterized phage protein (TIGR02218 family)